MGTLGVYFKVDRRRERRFIYAQAVIDRLRRVTVTLEGDATPITVTLSYGLATWPRDGADVDALLTVAGRQLYAMKRGHVAERSINSARSRHRSE